MDRWDPSRIDENHDREFFCIDESGGLAADGKVSVVKQHTVGLQLEARREHAEDLPAGCHELRGLLPPKHHAAALAHLHRSGGQYKEREEQQEGAVEVADLGPLLRALSGARNPDSYDHARHDQRSEDDDVEVIKSSVRSTKRSSAHHVVICPFNLTIVSTSRRYLSVHQNDRQHITSLSVRSSKRSFGEQSDSCVTLTLGDAGTTRHDAQQREAKHREEALERGERPRKLDFDIPTECSHDLVVDPHNLCARQISHCCVAAIAANGTVLMYMQSEMAASLKWNLILQMAVTVESAAILKSACILNLNCRVCSTRLSYREAPNAEDATVETMRARERETPKGE